MDLVLENQRIDSGNSIYCLKNLGWGQEVSFPSTRRLKQYSHKVFSRYPARSISLVPRSILHQLSQDWGNNEKANVLDPFMGSGTTAVETALCGMKAFGVELDPFARLISEVSMRGTNKSGKTRLLNTFDRVLHNWQQFDIDERFTPKLQNVGYWFTDDTMKNLLKLKKAIYTLSTENDLPFFKIVFADIIRPCSKAERQSLKPYISKKYAKTPAPVELTFMKSFQSHLSAILEYSEAVNFSLPTVSWIGHNAVDFTSSSLMDIAITSPPYINALDYVRCTKIESAWIDCSNNDLLKAIKRQQVGDLHKVKVVDGVAFSSYLLSQYHAEVLKKDSLRAGVLCKYFDDMSQNLASTYEVLKPQASYHIIIGNSTIRGIEIPTHEILAELAETIGFKWTGYHRYRIRDHRLSIPRNNNGGKIDYEHVISLTKL